MWAGVGPNRCHAGSWLFPLKNSIEVTDWSCSTDVPSGQSRLVAVHVFYASFAGFASALRGYFHDQFGFDPKIAGWAAAACVLAGSVMRPMGGVIADCIGGTRTLLAVYCWWRPRVWASADRWLGWRWRVAAVGDVA